MTAVRAGRATLNSLVAALAAIFGLGVIGVIIVLWGTAVLSLVTGPTGGWELAVIYAVVGVAAPLPMLWAVHGLSAIQRDRVRAMLGIGIRPPAERHGRWSIAPWRSAGTWRQLGYHLVAVGVDGVGGGLVLACWMAPILAVVFVVRHRLPTGDLGFLLPVAVALVVAAPWLARSHARISAGLARTLLGASRNDELALQVESLARSRADIVAATDAERRRIERDLHDGAQQRLVSLAMNLGIARANLVDLPELARLAIADAHDEAILVLSEMRAFIRGLHPAVLNDRGLDAALSGLVAHAPVPVWLTVDVPDRTSASVEAIAYFIVSEALTNVAKYAEATRVDVTVTRTGDLLRVAVTDDGRGGAAPTGDGTGLRGLAQRAASVDGTLTIDSPLGGPTTIVAELPCES